PEFLSVVWDSGLVREQIERVARTSAGIYKIAQPDLEQIWLPLPSTNEISRIVEHLTEQNSVLRRNLDVLNAVSLRASRLRQSILKLAFEGRLVPQDPKDESASVLLERIRAAREAGAVASPKPEGARKRRAGRGKG
ncbi:MAG: type I restriction endonuclease subunit S, partial [Anaerolineae bacterium]|nr:type I restriction endonuclease subunit S [Anaerolineae bacterium]